MLTKERITVLDWLPLQLLSRNVDAAGVFFSNAQNPIRTTHIRKFLKGALILSNMPVTADLLKVVRDFAEAKGAKNLLLCYSDDETEKKANVIYSALLEGLEDPTLTDDLLIVRAKQRV